MDDMQGAGLAGTGPSNNGTSEVVPVREMAKWMVIAYAVIKVVCYSFLILAVLWGLDVLTEYLPYWLYSIDANMNVPAFKGFFLAFANACNGVHGFVSPVFDAFLPAVTKLFSWFFAWFKKAIDWIVSIPVPE